MDAQAYGISPGPHPATPLPDTEPMSSERHHEDKAASNPHKVDTVHRLRRCIRTHPRQRHSSRGCAALTSSWASKPVSAWVRTQHSTGLRPGPYGYSLRNNIGNNNRIPGVSGNTGIDWPWQRQGMDARLLPHSPSWSNVSHAVFADAPCSPCVCVVVVSRQCNIRLCWAVRPFDLTSTSVVQWYYFTCEFMLETG